MGCKIIINLQQQKAQIDYDSNEEKKKLEAIAYEARQEFARTEIIRIRWEAEQMVKQIQYDAQKV